MIEHIWSVVCERAIVNRDTNNVSMVEIVEEIGIPHELNELMLEGKVGAIAVNLTIVSLWVRRDVPERGHGRVMVEGPSHERPTGRSGVSAFAVDLWENARMRTIGKIGVLPFRGVGEYRFLVQLQQEGREMWEDVSSIPILVREVG